MRRSTPNSSSRPPTCAGPTSAPIATATASVAPVACSSRGRCAAIAVLTNAIVANTTASSTEARESARRSTSTSMVGGAAALGSTAFARGSQALSGMPTTTCKAAHVQHAPRQPTRLSSHAESGQPTVLAKPAISVIPVIALREPAP